MNLRVMVGFLLFSVLSFSQVVQEETSTGDYDILTDRMIELEIDIDVQPPSTLILLLRKLSSPVLLLYTFYQKCKSKIIQFATWRYCTQDPPLSSRLA